jgi:hypothetical protein
MKALGRLLTYCLMGVMLFLGFMCLAAVGLASIGQWAQLALPAACVCLILGGIGAWGGYRIDRRAKETPDRARELKNWHRVAALVVWVPLMVVLDSGSTLLLQGLGVSVQARPLSEQVTSSLLTGVLLLFILPAAFRKWEKSQ